MTKVFAVLLVFGLCVSAVADAKQKLPECRIVLFDNAILSNLAFHNVFIIDAPHPETVVFENTETYWGKP